MRGFWAKLARSLARVPFAEDLVAAYYCVIDRNTPPQVRATLIGALAYFVLPADAVPDILAGLGFTDDAAVLVAALKLVGGHVTLAHRAAARAALARLGRGERPEGV
nr:YkvA family protein [Blastochloris tepida]